MDGTFRLGTWLVQPKLNTISSNGTTARLEPKVMEVLVCLAAKPGSALSKEEILKTVWPDTFVTDDVLIRSISELRRVFGDSARDARIIETISKRGYRLIPAVERLDIAQSSPSVALSAPKSSNTVRRLVRFAVVVMITFGVLSLLLAFNVKGVRETLAGHKRQLQIHSIAVLPLQNLSGNASDEYFADGMTEELITELSRIGGLRVISRTSAMHYKNTNKALPQIASELGIDGVVEGSILRSGNRVRVTAQLIYAPRETHVWAQNYEREMQDVLTLQGEIAVDIVTQIQTTLGSAKSTRLSPRPTVDPRAYEAYLKGVYHWAQSTPEDLRHSLEYFQETVALDPNFAGGYAGLGDVYLALISYDLLAESNLTRVQSLEQKAMQLDPSLAEPHESMAWVRLDAWDLAGAADEAERALALNPSGSDARLVGLWSSRLRSKPMPTLADFRQIRQLDPISPRFISSLGLIMRRPGLSDAVEFCQSALDLDNNSALAHYCMGEAYLEINETNRAISEFQRAVDIADISFFRRELASAQAAAGNRGPALRLLAEFKAQNDFSLYYDIAALDTTLGKRDAALAALQSCYAAHCRKLIFAGIEPSFEPLRSDPQFQGLMRRVTVLPLN